MKKLKLTIAGAGSTFTTDMIYGLCKEKEYFPLESITLYDIDFERQNKVFKISEVILRSFYPEVKIYQTTNTKEAFENADFVFAQIRAGGLNLREMDEMIPLKYDCVGQETCGAGGAAYGLRSIGAMIDLVNDIREVNRDAWILNYSNPAAIVSIALERSFPNDKRILNLCDMPVAIMVGLAEIVGLKVFDIKPYYFGLNHFGWFTKIITNNGEDITEELIKKIRGVGIKDHADEEMKDVSWQKTYEQLGNTLDDFREYIPNTYLQYYLYPKKIVKQSDINNVRARQVINTREKKAFSFVDEIVNKGILNENDIKKYGLFGMIHGRYMIKVASSLAYNHNMQAICIVKNDGCVDGLPNDAMVEVPCLLTKNGPVKLHVGSIPLFQKALLFNQYAYESLLVDAWFEKSKSKLLKAFVLNRTIIDTDIAKSIIEELIQANKGFWPEFK